MNQSADQWLNINDSREQKRRGTNQRSKASPFLVLGWLVPGIALILIVGFVLYPHRNTQMPLLLNFTSGSNVFRAEIPQDNKIAGNMFRAKIPVIDQPAKPPTKFENMPSVEKIVATVQPFVASPEKKEPTQETKLSQILDIQTIIETLPGPTTEVPPQLADTSSEKNELQQEIDPPAPVDPQIKNETLPPEEETFVPSQPIFAPSEQIKLPEEIDHRPAEAGPQPVKDVFIEITQERKIHSEKWLLSQASSNYTIQLMGARKEVLLHDFVERNQLLKQNEIALYQTTFKDKAWFQLLYGVYATKQDAQSAADNLPLNIRKASPWIRRLSAVQKAIRRKISP